MKINLNVAMVVAACLVHGTASLGDQSGMVELTNAKTFSIQDPDFREIIFGATDVLTIEGVPGIPEARVVVHNMKRGVVYLDEAGNVLRTRRDGRFETSAISPDGAMLAVLAMSTVRFPGSALAERELTWLHVENATGELVWERKDGLGIDETEPAVPVVTSRGYVVVSPNVHPPDRPYTGGRITRPLILDSSGDLVAELPARYYDGDISLSRDGAYCAINFADLDAESPVKCTGNQESGEQCLALFEVSTGRELWRRYFSQCGSGVVALTDGAERVICGAREVEWTQAIQRYPGTHSMYVFDRQGRMISCVETKGPLGAFAFSPDERLAVFSVIGRNDDDVLTLDAVDGRVVSQWSCEAICETHVFSISDSATVALRVLTRYPSGETSTGTNGWALVDRTGAAIYKEACADECPLFVQLSADGRTLRKVWKGGMTDYALGH